MTPKRQIERIPEPEVMDDRDEVEAYEQGDWRRINRSVARRILRLAGTDRGHALDLGTGPAEIPIFLCQMAPGWTVTAVDASPAMLKVARRKVREAGLEKRIRLLRGNARSLGQITESRPPGGRSGRRFDAVLSNSLLHHLHEPLAFWTEIGRVCRKGGAVMVQDLRRPPSRAQARALMRLHAGDDSKLLQQLFYQSLLAAFTPAEVREQLRQAGLDLRVRATTDRHMVIAGRR